jgi:hypothetical protein
MTGSERAELCETTGTALISSSTDTLPWRAEEGRRSSASMLWAFKTRSIASRESLRFSRRKFDTWACARPSGERGA